MVPLWMTFSDLFKVMIIQRQITWKWYNIDLYLQWPTNRKSYIIYRTAPSSMTFNDSTPIFKVMPFYDAEYLRNGTTYTHSVIVILIGTYTCPMQQCHFKCDLAKYSMTWSVAWSLCDSPVWKYSTCFLTDAIMLPLTTPTQGPGLLDSWLP